jgi:hypothetical protein
MFRTAPITRLPTAASSVRTATDAPAAIQLRQTNKPKWHPVLLRLQSGCGVHHDIHRVDLDAHAHFAIRGRRGEGGRPREEVIEYAESARVSITVGHGRQFDPAGMVDTRPATMGAVLALFGRMLRPAVLDASRAGALEAASASRARQR